MRHAMTVAILAGVLTVPAPAGEEDFEVLEQAVLKLAASEATITAQQAIETAMKEAGDARLVELELHLEGDRPVFGLEFLAGDGELEKAEGQTWIFDRDAIGPPSAGWKFGYTNPADGRATWRVAKDARSFSGSNVLTLQAESASRVFNLLMATGTSYQDVDVRTRIRPNTGEDDQGGGVIRRTLNAPCPEGAEAASGAASVESET